MMDRRTFVLAALATAAMPRAGNSQQPKKVARIGVLAPSSRTFFMNRFKAFQEGLYALGYVEGKSVIFEYRFADGNLDLLPGLTDELLRAKVDLIFTASGEAVLGAKKASKTIPIVFGAVQDPMASGIVDNLARPTGNATGLSALAPGLSGKRLELLKEAIPRLSRVAFLWSPRSQGSELSLRETRVAAEALGLQLQVVEVRDRSDFDRVFDVVLKGRADALVTTPDPVINGQGVLIVGFANKNRIPAMYAAPEFMNLGGLMSYAPNYAEMWRRAATYADKILKGAKPGDLPIEQPTKFNLVINLKTAKAIGVTVPRSLLLRADEVIE